jgi:hypothetical protein
MQLLIIEQDEDRRALSKVFQLNPTRDSWSIDLIT